MSALQDIDQERLRAMMAWQLEQLQRFRRWYEEKEGEGADFGAAYQRHVEEWLEQHASLQTPRSEEQAPQHPNPGQDSQQDVDEEMGEDDEVVEGVRSSSPRPTDDWTISMDDHWTSTFGDDVDGNYRTDEDWRSEEEISTREEFWDPTYGEDEDFRERGATDSANGEDETPNEGGAYDWSFEQYKTSSQGGARDSTYGETFSQGGAWDSPPGGDWFPKPQHTRAAEAGVPAFRGIPAFTCISCTNQVTTENVWQAPCQHNYCIDCLEILVRSSMTDESLYPPRCCRRVMPWEDLRDEIGGELVSAFEAKMEELETPMAERTYCSRPHCSAFLRAKESGDNFNFCSTCKTATCTECKAAWHFGDCREDRGLQATLKLAHQKGWQKCQSCNRVIELEHGCYHIM